MRDCASAVRRASFDASAARRQAQGVLGRTLPGLGVGGAALAVGLLVLVAGCPSSVPPAPPPPPGDAGDQSDAGSDIGVDTDQDGLCDRTEPTYHTDPNDPDTDGDGYPDGIEVLDGDDPLAPSEPLRDRVVFLTESADATATLTVTLAVRGAGESYTGAFQSLRTRDAFGRQAAAFFVKAVATLANPPDNVIAIDGEQFIAVTGRTLLVYDLSFAFGAELPRSCASAYSFRYNIKRQDGRLVSTTRYTLVVLPPGATPVSAPWCQLAMCY